MSYLTSQWLVFILILIVKDVVRLFLKNKVENDIRRLVDSLIMIPIIPIFWRVGYELDPLEPAIISTFYLPLFFTVFIVSMLLFRVIKYYINRRK